MKEKKGILDLILPEFFGVITELLGVAKQYSKEELERLKKKLVRYSFIYGSFFIALLFILIGLVKYLAFRGVFDEGTGFIVMGSSIIVFLAAYSLIKRP